MIDDAVKHKKIDLILTKSVSRFARNTVDSLSTIRLLKENGVEVYFEKENIYTFDSKGEMLLTIMSSIAQEESRSISENVSWGVQRRFEEGKYSVGKLVCGDCGCFFGSKVWHSTDKYRSVVWQCNNKFKAEEKCSTPHIREGVIKEVFIKALNKLITDKGPALDMMDHLKAKIDDTAALEGKLEKAAATFDEKTVLLQDYISKNAITEKELADGRYAELEKEYREAQAEKVKLQDELTERRRRSLMIKRFIDGVSGFEDLFTDFSENLWLGLVDVMVVVDKKSFRVKFKSGMEVPVEL